MFDGFKSDLYDIEFKGKQVLLRVVSEDHLDFFLKPLQIQRSLEAVEEVQVSFGCAFDFQKRILYIVEEKLFKNLYLLG